MSSSLSQYVQDKANAARARGQTVTDEDLRRWIDEGMGHGERADGGHRVQREDTSDDPLVAAQAQFEADNRDAWRRGLGQSASGGGGLSFDSSDAGTRLAVAFNHVAQMKHAIHVKGGTAVAAAADVLERALAELEKIAR